MALETHNAFTVAFLVAIVPAITILYYTLKNYERYLKDKYLFFSIITGLFLGILVSFFHLLISSAAVLIGNLLNFVLIIVSFSFFENLVKVVYVQLGRFEGKFDTTFYGATFGILIGSSITMGRTYAFFVRDLTVFEMVGILIFAVAMLFMNGGMGAWLGYGVHKNNMKWSLIYAVMISIPFNFFVFMWYLFPLVYQPAPGDQTLIAVAMIYGIAVFLYMYYKIMPESLPLKYKRELLKEARKKAQS